MVGIVGCARTPSCSKGYGDEKWNCGCSCGGCRDGPSRRMPAAADDPGPQRKTRPGSMAAQNADLQEQLTARQGEVATLREKHAQDLGSGTRNWPTCKARIEPCRRRSTKESRSASAASRRPSWRKTPGCARKMEQLKADSDRRSETQIAEPIRAIRPIGRMGPRDEQDRYGSPTPPRRLHTFFTASMEPGRSPSRWCLFIAAATRPTNIGCGAEGTRGQARVGLGPHEERMVSAAPGSA